MGVVREQRVEVDERTVQDAVVVAVGGGSVVVSSDGAQDRKT